jgi:hypothetical protein
MKCRWFVVDVDNSDWGQENARPHSNSIVHSVIEERLFDRKLATLFFSGLDSRVFKLYLGSKRDLIGESMRNIQDEPMKIQLSTITAVRFVVMELTIASNGCFRCELSLCGSRGQENICREEESGASEHLM